MDRCKGEASGQIHARLQWHKTAAPYLSFPSVIDKRSSQKQRSLRCKYQSIRLLSGVIVGCSSFEYLSVAVVLNTYKNNIPICQTLWHLQCRCRIIDDLYFQFVRTGDTSWEFEFGWIPESRLMFVWPKDTHSTTLSHAPKWPQKKRKF